MDGRRKGILLLNSAASPVIPYVSCFIFAVLGI